MRRETVNQPMLIKILIVLFFQAGFFVLFSPYAFAKIYINEFVSDPKSGEKEWVELYNDGEEKDISGWVLYDNTGKKEELDGEIDKFLVVENKKFTLNNSGDVIVLEDESGDQKDKIEYGDKGDISKPGKGQSSGRNPDGEDKFMVFSEPTPGKANKIEKKEYPRNLRINELYPNPNSGEKEWIELYNYGSKDIDLEGWTMEDNKSNDLKFEKGDLIKAGEYFTINNSFSLNNDGDSASLFNPNRNLIDSAEYKKDAPKGSTWAYNKTDKKWNWSKYPTSGKENVFRLNFPKGIVISEVFPNPKGDENSAEYIEIFNGSEENVNLKDWVLRDSSKTGGFTVAEDMLVKPGDYKTFYRTDFKFALNNSNETAKLLDPNGDITSEVSFKKTYENFSYGYESQSKKWRWSKFLTPEKGNKFQKPVKLNFSVADTCYRGAYCEFSAEPNLKNADFKITWDFGDGHKSYKEEAIHKFEKTGNYRVSAQVFDGSEEVSRIFRVEVKKFSQDVEIVAFCPNPEGKDSDNEWIRIKNNSGKKVNLSGWKIATGKNSARLVNHPVLEKFVIQPGETRKLSRKISRFSLLNKKGMIELRYPDGKAADKIKYEKDKIADDEVYATSGGEWSWTGSAQYQTVPGGEADTEVIEEVASIENKNSEIIKAGTNVADTEIETAPSEDTSGKVLGAEVVMEKSNRTGFFKNIFYAINGIINGFLNRIF